jgi:hypothetical protein
VNPGQIAGLDVGKFGADVTGAPAKGKPSSGGKFLESLFAFFAATRPHANPDLTPAAP